MSFLTRVARRYCDDWRGSGQCVRDEGAFMRRMCTFFKTDAPKRCWHFEKDVAPWVYADNPKVRAVFARLMGKWRVRARKRKGGTK